MKNWLLKVKFRCFVKTLPSFDGGQPKSGPPLRIILTRCFFRMVPLWLPILAWRSGIDLKKSTYVALIWVIRVMIRAIRRRLRGFRPTSAGSACDPDRDRGDRNRREKCNGSGVLIGWRQKCWQAQIMTEESTFLAMVRIERVDVLKFSLRLKTSD